MIQVQCVFDAWDSKNARYYSVGVVPEFDETNEDLNSLLVPGGKAYVFQYPGHVAPAKETSIHQVAPATASAPVEDKPKQKMSASHKQKMIDARKKKREERAARLQQIAAETAA